MTKRSAVAVGERLRWIRGEGADFVDALDAAVRPLLVRWAKVRQCHVGQVMWILILSTDQMFQQLGVPAVRRADPTDGDLIEEGEPNRFGARLGADIAREVLGVCRKFPHIPPALQYMAVRFFRTKLSIGVAQNGGDYLTGTRGGKVERKGQEALKR